MSDLDLDALAGELADFAPAKKKQATYTPHEKRIIAGFEDIERFYEEHGRLPQHGEDRDIFERLYMPCGWTGCASRRNVAPCSQVSINTACLIGWHPLAMRQTNLIPMI